MIESIFFSFIAISFGLAMGSFCGSASYRIAHEWSLFKPSSSHCPSCKKRLGWKENIPLFSYFIQRGRCSSCSAKLSLLYPIAELSFASWSILIFLKYGLSPEYLVFMSIGMILLLISLVDLEAFFIPDLLVIIGSIIAGSASFMGIGIAMPEAIIAALIGSLLFQGIRLAYQLIRKQEGMGFGDVKLMFLLGLCVGIIGLPYVLLLSTLLAIIFTTLGQWKNVNKETRLPFGPYLCAGAALYMLFGDIILKIFGFNG